MHLSYKPFPTLSAGASGDDPAPAALFLALNTHSQLAFHVEPSAYTSRFHIGTVAFSSSIAKWHASVKEWGGRGVSTSPHHDKSGMKGEEKARAQSQDEGHTHW